MRSHRIRHGKPTGETRYDIPSLRNGAQSPQHHAGQHRSIKNSWCWERDLPLREDTHRSSESNGVQILTTHRILAINVLRFDGIWFIPWCIAALADDLRGLLRPLGWRAAGNSPG